MKAVALDGRVESFDLEAFDRGGAIQQAEGRGYSVLAVRSSGLPQLGWHREGRFPLVLFSQELLALLAAGLPLVDAIATLAQKEGAAGPRDRLEALAAALRQGRPFSTVLEQMPDTFPPLYVATVRAAERTSDLGAALGRFVAYAQQLEAVRKRLLNASIYPLLLVGVGGLVGLFLLLYVVPRFARIYEERAVELPLLSRLVLSWGGFVEGQGLLLLGLAAGAALALACASRSTALRGRLAAALWRMPAIGERLKLYQLARFYRTAGMLVGGGMPLVGALGMAGELLQPGLRARLASARRDISEGKPVAASMEAHGLATPVALRMLAVGEQGGNMGEMMDRAAAFHDEEIARWVDWFTRLFEPLLMAAIGLVIGTIVILMYMPIFELAGSLR